MRALFISFIGLLLLTGCGRVVEDAHRYYGGVRNTIIVSLIEAERVDDHARIEVLDAQETELIDACQLVEHAAADRFGLSARSEKPNKLGALFTSDTCVCTVDEVVIALDIRDVDVLAVRPRLHTYTCDLTPKRLDPAR